MSLRRVQQFLEELRAIYGRLPPIAVTDDASYGSAFDRFGITRIVRRPGIRNRIERWIDSVCRKRLPGRPPAALRSIPE